MNSIEREKYLQRIGYTGSTLPNLQTLTSLQQQHLLNIPFENLDIHLGIPIELNTGKLFDKLITKKRGGFCYELNGLFYTLLLSMRFDVRMVSARVYNTIEKYYSLEYDHLALIVNIDGVNYLVDTGFGEFTFSPLAIVPGKIQEDKRGKFMIAVNQENCLQVNKASGDDWVPEYIFTLTARRFDEFEPMCRYHQTSPDSHFVKNKICSILINQGSGRVTLTGKRLKISNGNEVKEEPVVDDTAFNRYLNKYFEIIPEQKTSDQSNKPAC